MELNGKRLRRIWRFRLAARTHASHAWNTGSIPVGATIKEKEFHIKWSSFSFFMLVSRTPFLPHSRCSSLAIIPGLGLILVADHSDRGYKKQSRAIMLLDCQYLLLRGLDSNERPPGYEPGELPTAPPRDVLVCSCKGITIYSKTKV